MPSHDVVIIGSGPAGLTAALYTARANLEPVVVEGLLAGGQLTQTTDVENYPGFPEGIMGPELMEKFKVQAARFGATFVPGDATSVDFSTRPFTITTEETVLEASAVIVAPGASPRTLGPTCASRPSRTVRASCDQRLRQLAWCWVMARTLPGWSLRWYDEVLTGGKWLQALVNSLRVGVAATLLAVLLGTLAAPGLARGEGTAARLEGLRGPAVQGRQCGAVGYPGGQQGVDAAEVLQCRVQHCRRLAPGRAGAGHGRRVPGPGGRSHRARPVTQGSGSRVAARTGGPSGQRPTGRARPQSVMESPIMTNLLLAGIFIEKLLGFAAGYGSEGV